MTGGSRGIGKAIASALSEEGSHVILAARNQSELELAREDIKRTSSGDVEVFVTDVSQESSVRNMVAFVLDRFSTIDILVNNAGIYGPIGPLPSNDSHEWIQTVMINLYGTFLCCKAVLPIMIKKRRGKIINLSGGGASYPFPRFSAYAASKVAVVRLTETLAEEVAEYDIHVNAMAPGGVNTRLLDQVLEAGEAAGIEFLAKARKQKAEGGVRPEKVAELAVFLASSASDGLSGRLISCVWDNWRDLPRHLDAIRSSDIYTIRRITPKDRGFAW